MARVGVIFLDGNNQILAQSSNTKEVLDAVLEPGEEKNE